MNGYREAMLYPVRLKGPVEMDTALATINTGDLPDNLALAIHEYFLSVANETKATKGVWSIVQGAVRMIGNALISDRVYEDFYAKQEQYIRAIVADDDDATHVWEFISLHHQPRNQT